MMSIAEKSRNHLLWGSFLKLPSHFPVKTYSSFVHAPIILWQTFVCMSVSPLARVPSSLVLILPMIKIISYMPSIVLETA